MFVIAIFCNRFFGFNISISGFLSCSKQNTSILYMHSFLLDFSFLLYLQIQRHVKILCRLESLLNFQNLEFKEGIFHIL